MGSGEGSCVVAYRGFNLVKIKLTCKHCGSRFSASSPHAIWCSRKCRYLHLRVSILEDQRQQRLKNVEQRVFRTTCKWCGVKFVWIDLKGHIKKHGMRTYCSTACMDRLRCKHRKATRVLKPPCVIEKKCIVCNKSFSSIGSNANRQRYCSRYCCRLNCRPLSPDKVIKRCIRCGTEFATDKRHRRKLYCSHGCQVASRRNNRMAGRSTQANCRFCGVVFKRYSFDKNGRLFFNSSQKFCSVRCSGAYKRKLSPRLVIPKHDFCIVCDTLLTYRVRFCSRRCHTEFHSVVDTLVHGPKTQDGNYPGILYGVRRRKVNSNVDLIKAYIRHRQVKCKIKGYPNAN